MIFVSIYHNTYHNTFGIVKKQEKNICCFVIYDIISAETVMREFLSGFWTIYTLYFERGRLIPLFLAAVIILILLGKKYGSRIHPLLFILSVWTAVSYAFSLLIFSVSGNKETNEETFTESKNSKNEETKHNRKRTGLMLLSVFLCVLMIVFSASPVWTDDFLEGSAKRKEREDTLNRVCETILSEDAQAKIMASSDIMPYLLSYSADFVPLYSIRVPSDTKKRPKDEQRLLEIFSSQHPDFEQVHRLCHDEEHFYAIVDHEKMWPEHGYDYGFDLMATVDHYEIYAYTGGRNE